MHTHFKYIELQTKTFLGLYRYTTIEPVVRSSESQRQLAGSSFISLSKVPSWYSPNQLISIEWDGISGVVTSSYRKSIGNDPEVNQKCHH